MLQIHSSVKLEEIEVVVKAAARRHNSNVLAISHVGQLYGAKALAGQRDAYIFTLSHSKLDAALLSADIHFASFLPSRVAAWADEKGVMLQAMAPSKGGDE